MSRLSVATKQHPCPICGKPEDCKWNRDGLHFCLRVHSGAHAPSGWRYVKDDRNGVFGLLVRDQGKSEPARPWPVVSKAKPKPEAKTINIASILVQRSRLYEQMLSQLRLDSDDAFWLQDRGLSDEAVAFYGLKSYHSADRLTGLSPDLPGVSPENPSKLCGNGGLLLPVRNLHHQILGFQVVPQGRILAENSNRKWKKAGKYIWLSSKSQGGQGPTLPAPYDSLPLGFFKPKVCQDAETLYLSEGMLKSMLIAFRMGWPVLGTAAGGRFCAKQLEETLKAGSFKRVVLIPDAGMLDNVHIARAYAALAKVVHSLGRELEMLWWGQKDKSLGDFDDYVLTNGNQLEFCVISYDAYFLMQSEAVQGQADALKVKRRLFWLPRKQPIKPALCPDVVQLRQAMASTFEQILLSGKRREARGRFHLFQDPAGTGKTTTLSTVLKALSDSGQLKARVLFLVRTKERMVDIQSILGDAAFYMHGRSEAPESSFFCQRLETYSSIANARFNPGKFCQNCHDELTYLGKTCPFKEQQRGAQEARIVVATNHSYMGEGTKLEKFDVIVVDEDFTDAGITETVAIHLQRDIKRIMDIIEANPS